MPKGSASGCAATPTIRRLRCSACRASCRRCPTTAHVLDAVDVPANGVTFCTGSFGARPDNDLPAMVEALGPRIHFVHLRNVRRDSEEVPCSFFEDEHLNGQADMVAVIAALLAEEKRRRS